MKVPYKFITCFFISWLVAFNSQAQFPADRNIPTAYRAIRWDTDDGLGKIRWHTAIIKDVNGFIWFGSNHGELSRFDGNTFKQYYPDKSKPGSIAHTNCLSIVEDSLHNLWIGTGEGLSRYNIRTDTFTNFTSLKVLNTERTSVIPFWSTQQEVYCVESRTTITSYNINTLERKKLFDILEEDNVGNNFVGMTHAVYDATSNSVYMLLSKAEGLAQFFLSTGKRVFYLRPTSGKRDSYGHLDAEAMRYDKKRKCIWINSHDGLFQFTLSDRHFHRIEAMEQMLTKKNYYRLVGIDIDRYDRIWFATMPGGMLIYDPELKTITSPLKDTALLQAVSDENLKIYCARDGMVWLSYYTLKGIYQVIPYFPSVTQYAENPGNPDSLCSSDIRTLVNAGNRSMWIGTGNGLNILSINTNKFKKLGEKDLPGIKGAGIVPMVIDTITKKAWLNAFPPDKVYVMDMVKKICREVVFKDSSGQAVRPVNIINSISAPYKDGCIFFDDGYGLFEIAAIDSIARLVIPYSHRQIFGLIIVGDSLIFLKTIPLNQTFRKANGQWIKTPFFLDSLGWNSLQFEAVDQTYWVSSTNLITHYDKNFRVIRQYKDESGVISSPLSLVPDGRGNIWFNNDRKGIGVLKIRSGIITMLAEPDGYSKQWFDSFSAHGKAVNDDIFFAASPLSANPMLTQITSEQFTSYPPSIVYLADLNVKENKNPDSAAINNIDQMNLKYFQNTINIKVGVIDFYSKGRNHIRYRIENLEDNWQYIPVNSIIHYEGLPPARYTLIMQASNSSNEFNGPEKKLIINISPPFWQTWWFRMFLAFAVIGIIYGFIQYRSRNLKKSNILLEKKVNERTNELNNSLSKLKNTQEQLVHSEKMASLGELTSGIAHEIKNPLNFINNFSEINMDLISELEEERLPRLSEASKEEVAPIIKTLKKNSEKINHHGQRVDDIVKSMLQHSRIGNLTKEPVNVNLLCEESLKLAYHGFKAKEKTFQASFETHFDPGLPQIMAVPQDLSRVLLNLFNNAFYAVYEKKKKMQTALTTGAESERSYKPIVTVGTKRYDGKIAITVSDNGTGITQKIINKIFQPFFTTKPAGEGTGLGLSMSYDIITKSHGGELLAKSKEGLGTDFEILIPV